MKKVLFLAIMAIAVILASCKNENKNEDPVTPPTPSEKDTFNVQFRYYVSPDMINYLDHKLYVTLPGETEKQLTFPEPQSLSDSLDLGMKAAITVAYLECEVIPYDSFKVYVFNFVSKKGNCSFRTELTKKSVDLPDELVTARGYAYLIDNKLSKDSRAQCHRFSTDPDTLDANLKLIYKEPITISIP